MERPALLVIDMLNDFLLPGAPLEVPAAREMVPRLQDRIGDARTARIPVIYVCDSHEPNDPEFLRMGWPAHALAGTSGAEVIDALKPLPRDIIIPKRSYSAFFATPLDGLLKKYSVNRLLITGCVTNICVLYTVAGAVERGYGVTVFRDCVAGMNPKDHACALRQMSEVLGAEII